MKLKTYFEINHPDARLIKSYSNCQMYDGTFYNDILNYRYSTEYTYDIPDDSYLGKILKEVCTMNKIFINTARGNSKTKMAMDFMKYYITGKHTCNSPEDFDKIIVNGPATIGFINGNRTIIKLSKNDFCDIEKAMLMLYVKSQFASAEEFHSWYKRNMAMMNEASLKYLEKKGEKS